MTSTTVDFDGGTVGVDVAAGSNGIQSVPDALAPKFAAGFHGAASVRAGGAANTSDTRFRVDYGFSGSHMGSLYVKYNTAHSSSGNFCIFLTWSGSSNATIARCRVGSNGELNIQDGATTVVRTGSASDIPVNSKFRFDWQVVSGTSTIAWKLWYDPEADAGGTPDLSGSFSYSSGTHSRISLGAASSTSLTKDFSFDTLRVQNDDTTWWNAFDPGDPPGDDPWSNVYIWDGADEIPVTTMGVWNGTTEIEMTALEIT